MVIATYTIIHGHTLASGTTRVALHAPVQYLMVEMAPVTRIYTLVSLRDLAFPFTLQAEGEGAVARIGCTRLT